jgi:hypothetical protein
MIVVCTPSKLEGTPSKLEGAFVKFRPEKTNKRKTLSTVYPFVLIGAKQLRLFHNLKTFYLQNEPFFLGDSSYLVFPWRYSFLVRIIKNIRM